MQMLIS